MRNEALGQDVLVTRNTHCPVHEDVLRSTFYHSIFFITTQNY